MASSKEYLNFILDQLPGTTMELPYEGGKEMILVEDVDNRELLKTLLKTVYAELPAAKKKGISRN